MFGYLTRLYKPFRGTGRTSRSPRYIVGSTAGSGMIPGYTGPFWGQEGLLVFLGTPQALLQVKL